MARLSKHRKRRSDDSEKLDRWLVSYADFITLLFAFFVVLYAISSVNEGKYRVVSDSLLEAFDTIPKSLEPVQVGEISRTKRDSIIENVALPSETRQREEYSSDALRLNLKEMADDIEAAMEGLIGDGQIRLLRSDDWLEIEINTSILFPSGDTRLVEGARPVLKRIANILKPFPNPVNVEGFTDNVPISTDLYPSNWELSAARAATVVHLFTREGIQPSRMTAIGYGEYRPKASNETARGRAKNRRVVLAVLAEDKDIRFQRDLENLDQRPHNTGFPTIEIERR